jgi:uncharacterized protein YciI
MKHFVVEVTYIAPLSSIDAALADHRAFLQLGYDQGLLLCSGPQEPRTGGVMLARAPSRDDLRDFFRSDPFQARNLAKYRFVEFTPVKHQGWLADWVEGK